MADYSELTGYPKEKYGQNGQLYVERKLKCAWADRYTVLNTLGGNGGQMYPYRTDAMGARASGGGIEPFGCQTNDVDDSPIASYSHAIVTIIYATDTAVKLSDTWVTEELQPSQKFVSIDAKDLTWAGGGPVNTGSSIVKLQPSFDYVVTYHHLLGYPLAALTEVGKINNGPVSSWLLGATFSENTLLYTRPILTRAFDPGLLNTFRLVYRFSYNPATWHTFWNTKRMTYERVTNDGASVDIYESTGFSALIPT